jgi:flagellar motor switch protein FliG
MAKLKEQLEFAFDEIIATYKRVKARSNDRALPVSERLIASRQAADIRQQVQEDLGTNIDEYIENMEEER